MKLRVHLMFLLLLITLPLVAHNERFQCSFNGDCQDPLVCANGYCRAQCMSDRDCHSGWVCGRPQLSNPPTDGRALPAMGDGLNRCVAPGTANLVRLDGSSYTLLPLGPASAGATTVGVPSTGAGAGYAVPVMQQSGTPPQSTPSVQSVPATPSVPAGSGHVLQAPITAVNPQIRPRSISAGGFEFMKGESNHLYMRRPGGEWSNVGAGVLASEPAAVQATDGTIFVVARGLDNAIWGVQCTNAGVCSDWFSIGGELTSAPQVEALPDGRVRVFATGTDGRPWYVVHQAGQWSAWAPK